jgi:hypothetical protein
MKGHLRRRGDALELPVYIGHNLLANRKRYATYTFSAGKQEADYD